MSHYPTVSAHEAERRNYESRLGVGYAQSSAAGRRFSSDIDPAGKSTRGGASGTRASDRYGAAEASPANLSDVGDETEIPGVGRGTYRRRQLSPERRSGLSVAGEMLLSSGAHAQAQQKHMASSHVRSTMHSSHTHRSAAYPQSSPARGSAGPPRQSTTYAASNGVAQRLATSRFGSPSKGSSTRRTGGGDLFSSVQQPVRPQAPTAALASGSDDSDSDGEESDASSHHPPRFIGDLAESTGNHEAFRATPLGESIDDYAGYERRARMTEQFIQRLETLQSIRDGKSSDVEKSGKRASYNDPHSPFLGSGAAQSGAHMAQASPRVPPSAHSRLIRSPESPSPASINLSRAQAHRERQQSAAGEARGQADGQAARAGSRAGGEESRRRAQQSTAVGASPVVGSTFGAAAEAIKRDLRDAAAGDDERSSSSGFAAGTQDSSGATKVDDPQQKHHYGEKLSQPKHANQFFLPSGQYMGPGAPAAGIFLPDVTGLTSALNSPDKARVGVRHVPVRGSGEDEGVLGVDAQREGQLQRLATYVDGIKAELAETHSRIRGLEASQESLAANVVRISEQMSDFHDEVRNTRKGFGRAQAQSQRADETFQSSCVAEPATSMQQNEGLASHAEHLTSQASYYEEQIERLRAQQRQEQSRQQPHQPAAPASTSRARTSHASVAGDRDSEMERQIAEVREDVAGLAAEFVSLCSIVEEQMAGQSGPRRSSRRSTTALRGYGSEGDEQQREDDRAGAHGNESEHRARFDTPHVASSPIKKSAPLRKVRSPFVMSSQANQSMQDADETIRPRSSAAPRAPHVEDDISMVQERAEATFRSVATHSGYGHAAGGEDAHAHDPRKCTVCSRARKNERRRLAKREKLEELERRREALVQEEEALLAVVDSAVSAGGPKHAKTALRLDAAQLSILQRVIDELIDDFWHQREVYRSLSAELGLLEPYEYRYKITSKHVSEAVDALEYKAERINLLHSLLPDGSPPPTTATRRAEHAAKQSAQANASSSHQSAGKHGKGKGVATEREREPVTLRTVLGGNPAHSNR